MINDPILDLLWKYYRDYLIKITKIMWHYWIGSLDVYWKEVTSTLEKADLKSDDDQIKMGDLREKRIW
jgi:hypothetical protein